MSVLRIPTRVMRMPFVSILTVPQTVLVNEDSLEMENFVKVCKNITAIFKKGENVIKYLPQPYTLQVLLFVCLFVFFCL